MYNDFLNWFYIIPQSAVDRAGEPFYWQTPIGSFSIIAIFLCASYSVFRIKQDVINHLYNYTLIIVAVSAMWHIHENTNPKHQMMTIVTALAIKALWNTWKHIRSNNK